MSARPLPTSATETREQRIEGILKELRPKIDEEVRTMVERAVQETDAGSAAYARVVVGSGCDNDRIVAR